MKPGGILDRLDEHAGSLDDYTELRLHCNACGSIHLREGLLRRTKSWHTDRLPCTIGLDRASSPVARTSTTTVCRPSIDR